MVSVTADPKLAFDVLDQIFDDQIFDIPDGLPLPLGGSPTPTGSSEYD